MKKILLIQPYVGIFDTITFNIPIGLLAISRYIHKDYDVIIIDQRFSDWKSKLLINLKEDVLCVGITCLTGYQIYFASEIAKLIKSIKPYLPVVFGGIHPSVLPEQTLKENYIDFVVIGEGEITFKNLVEAINLKKSFSEIANIGYKVNDKIIINKKTDFIDLVDMPELPYSLIEIKKYKGLSAQNQGDSFLIEGGRGCVHECIFCYNASFNNRIWRPFPVEKIISQIEYYYKNFDIKGFFIIDDSFFINKKRVNEFLKIIAEKKLKIEWCCEANLSDLLRLSESDFFKLENSGLSWLSVGVESGSKFILKKLKKKVSIENLYKFNNLIRTYNINIRYNFMTGYIWDDLKTIKETINVCIKLTSKNKKIMVQPLYVSVPLPGTNYIKQAEIEGFKVPDSFLGWSEFDPFSVLDYLPWIDKKKKKIFELLMYSSFFIDNKPEYHSNNSFYGKIITFFGRLYRPFARYRFRNLFSFCFIEKYYFIIMNYYLKKNKKLRFK